jgi:hypothetical protein
MSIRFMRSVLVLMLLIVLLGLPGAAQACCGNVPDYFLTVHLIGEPNCRDRTVKWSADYRLPGEPWMIVSVLPDPGVVQNQEGVHMLQEPTSVDTVGRITSWEWKLTRLAEPYRRVRIQFDVYAWDPNVGAEFADGALILFYCDSHNQVTNLAVTNVSGHWLDLG